MTARSCAPAFAANAFFTAGLVLFEAPTGVLADLRGRRLSYLLGTLALALSDAHEDEVFRELFVRG